MLPINPEDQRLATLHARPTSRKTKVTEEICNFLHFLQEESSSRPVAWHHVAK